MKELSDEEIKKASKAFAMGAIALSIGVIKYQEDMKRLKELEAKKCK